MKKLMIAAAIVCAAAFTQAATVSWSASGIAPLEGATATDCCAYLIDNTFAGYANLKDAVDAVIAGGSSASGVIKTVDGLTTGTTWKFNVSNSPLEHDNGYAAGDMIDCLMIILDVNNAEHESAANYLAAAKAQQSFNTSLKLSATMGTQAGNEWVSVVPEPTTGLLMLIGMAGLALRRRRA